MCDLIMLTQDTTANPPLSKSSNRLTAIESPLNDNYMAVIKESNMALLSRRELQSERQKILDLDFQSD